MEQQRRRDILSEEKLCRFCLSATGSLTNMYIKRKENKTTSLGSKILSSISVECFPSDKLPQYICDRCIYFMNIVCEYKNICRESDKALTEYLQTGAPLTPMKWPQCLTRVLSKKLSQPATPDVEVVNIGGGTTVEVSQDGTDTEEEGENVYNVKIEDGNAEEASACVKIVENATPTRMKKDSAELEFTMAEGTATASAPVETLGSWACDECHNSYPLQQLLELHKMQKHRAASLVCDLCEGKFNSKYELQVHMSGHTDAEPFRCVLCRKGFQQEGLLRRHERVFHRKMLCFPCHQCPAKFLSKDDLATHEMRHRSTAWKLSCDLCDKKFSDKYTLNRHKDNVHVKSSYACEYCPARFCTVSKLTRHVRMHAGEKAYPCKFCDKRFTKSHHCKRHMKSQHSDLVNSSEEYRCEECNATFANQDDLIYHSAIHATQNLVCPLCQEKFPDVDAVTTHIKSHVNGSEHMCDFCELMFTTQEKLENHVTAAHNDELMGEDPLQDEDSMEMGGDDDEDSSINVKEEGDHMLVEINKPESFMLKSEEKNTSTYSEESEPELTSFDAPAPSQLPTMPSLTPAPPQAKAEPPKPTQINLVQNVTLKPEEAKRKVAASETVVVEKKVEKPKSESAGASDKSLRLLEKELQELQRTNKREEPAKTPAKPVESLKNRRAQLYSSTPKQSKQNEERKPQAQAKSTPKKYGVKENKKPDEPKDKTNNNNVKDDKEVKTKDDKETKTKEDKEGKGQVPKEENKEKGVVRNGAANKSGAEENVRRSSRGTKVKDYAKMLQTNIKIETTLPSDDDTDDDDEEYVESEKQSEGRPKRRANPKQTPQKAQATPKGGAKKRGRPRKDQSVTQEVPVKMKKNDSAVADESMANTSQSEASTSQIEASVSQNEDKMETDQSTAQEKAKQSNQKQDKMTASEPSCSMQPSAEVKQPVAAVTPVTPPSQSTLKKVPIKALPPGVKPLPLPAARTVGSEISEMQIGKKVVKVQKIVMTKAEVEAMAKKGLVEMKDGTMVLKPGVKLTDPNALKAMVGEKQSPPKAAPTRCDLDGQ